MIHTKDHLKVPTVHLNGTSQGELLEQLTNACEAIRVAEAVLRQASPNARDYYVQADQGNFVIAQNQHFVRVGTLRQLLEELEYIAEKVSDQ